MASSEREVGIGVHSAGSSPSDAINPAVIEYRASDTKNGSSMTLPARICKPSDGSAMEIDRRVQLLVGKLTA